MATPRSEQDLLKRLEVTHLNGGRPAFHAVLDDLCVSTIKEKFEELFARVVADAEGLKMPGDPKVKYALRHIARARLSRRRQPRPSVSTYNGFALMH